MKKNLIAPLVSLLTSLCALAVITAPSAFALDMLVSGTVEYRYIRDKVANVAKNPKLSQKTAEVSFVTTQSSDGLRYDSLLKIKSGTDNNATTQSALWISGSLGGVLLGQVGSAVDSLSISGKVDAGSYVAGTAAAKPVADVKENERITYFIPAKVDGLSAAYTTSLRGNVSTNKSDRAKASKNWAVKYTTKIKGGTVTAAHAFGESATKTVAGKKTHAISSTITGMTASYDKYTVGYGVFSTGKHKSGTNKGVKYASGAWAVGYTIENAVNKGVSDSTLRYSKTSAYSTTYKVREGFSVAVSRSFYYGKKGDGTKTNNAYTKYSTSYKVADGFSVDASRSFDDFKNKYNTITTKISF